MKRKETIVVCLNCYRIRFQEKNKSIEKDISNVFGNNDLISIMEKFGKWTGQNHVFKNKKEDRILYHKAPLRVSRFDNIYSGVVMKGHNGPQTSIDELIGSQVQQVGTVSKDQFHCLPYFFLMYLDRNKPDSIVFIAQSYRQFGFKEIFEECFRDFIGKESNTTTIIFNPLSVAPLFEQQMNNGIMKKVTFIKYGLHSSVEELVRGDNLLPEEYEMQLSLKSKKGIWGLKKRLNYENTSIIEQIKIDNFDYDEAVAEVFLSGRKRIINISKPTEHPACYDITDQIEIDNTTKLPNFDHITTAAFDILNNDLIPHI